MDYSIHVHYSYGGFHKWGYTNSWMAFVRANPINMDDDWGDPYDSGKPHMDYSIHMHYSYGCFTKTIAITG